jgi:hypothetical protein
MPFKSKLQERWAHTAEGTKALGGPTKVKEWDEATKGKSIPEKVHHHKHTFAGDYLKPKK